jgi:hypothetical protein
VEFALPANSEETVQLVTNSAIILYFNVCAAAQEQASNPSFTKTEIVDSINALVK